jgi:hypothetical protein
MLARPLERHGYPYAPSAKTGMRSRTVDQDISTINMAMLQCSRRRGPPGARRRLLVGSGATGRRRMLRDLGGTMRFVWLSALATALGLLAAPLAAEAPVAGKPDRIRDEQYSRRDLRSAGSVPPGSARPRVRGREEHRRGVSGSRREDRAASRPDCRACASEGRGDRHRRSHSNACHPGGDFDDSHRYGV